MPKVRVVCHQPPAQVCVIQKAFLGDVLLTTPMIQFLLDQGCAVTVLTHREGQALLSHTVSHPALTIIVVRKPLWWLWRPFRMTYLAMRFHRKFDVVFGVHRGFEASVLGRLMRRLVSVGFENADAACLWDQVVPRRQPLHEVEKNHQMLEMLWGKSCCVSPGWLKKRFPSGNRLCHDVLKLDQPYIVIHPGSKWATKRWGRFGDLITALLIHGDDRLQCRKFVVTGSRPERAMLDRERGWVWNSDRVVDLMGQLSMGQYLDVCAGADLVIGNDSFSTHVASAHDVPCIAIFGSTVPDQGFGPLSNVQEVIETMGLSCRPCGAHGHDRCPQKHFRCMKDISVDRVVCSVLSILK